jgi:rod shape-determining protein MreC
LLLRNRIKKFWILIILIFAGLIFISTSTVRKSWNPITRLLVEIVAPFQKITRNTVRITEDLWLKYFGLINTSEENTRLKKEIDLLTMENFRYRELLATHQRLQQLLQFKDTTEQNVLAAQVIGRDPTGYFRSIIIDKGENSGIKVNMPVVNSNGAVGQVVSLSYNYAKVLLVIDQNSSVDSIIQRSRDSGIIKGLSSKVCLMENVVKTSDIHVGDVVVTSGLGGVFPKGIPVGEVIEVEDPPGELFKDVKIKPSVDFSKLEEVLVILKEGPLSNPLIEKD